MNDAETSSSCIGLELVMYCSDTACQTVIPNVISSQAALL